MSPSSRCAVRLAVSFALALAILAPPSALAVSSPFDVDNPFISAGLKVAAEDRDRDNSAAAEAERKQSRQRWAGLSSSESLALGRRIFPEAFAFALFDGENPAPGLEIVDYQTSTTALAETEDGERLLVQSSVPLRAQTANGQMAPVDLSLRESSDTFTTANSNADIQIGKDIEDGASLPSKDVTITPLSARNADGQQSGGRVFYPAVDTDTDYVVVPQPHGGEVGWLLRSADSPERFLLDVDMPEGASIRRPQPEKPIPGDPPRGLEIVKDGKVLVAIKAPIAYDANRAPVETKLTIVGDRRIAMSVKHRNEDLKYPLYADPEVMILANNPNYWYGWGPAWYSHGAAYSTNPSTNFYGVGGFAANNGTDAYNYNGIYLSMPTNTTYWPRGTGVNWNYKAPVDSYIYRAILGHVGLNGLEGNTYKWYSWGYRFAYLYTGLMDPTRSNWDAGQDWAARLNGTQYAAAGGIFGPNPDARAGWDFDHCYSRCNNLAGSDSNEAILGLAAINNYNNNNIATADAKASVTMNYAQIYLGDRFAPSMRWDAAPANRDWRDDSASPIQAITPTALDRGLGVKSITLSDAATGNGAVSSSCTGHPQLSPCQTAWTAYAGFRYTLNEGINTMSLTPRDIIGNTGAAASWTEKIDRTKPRVVSMSGTLYDDRIESQPAGMGLYRELEHLDVQVADDHSGVQDVQLLVDGQPISTKSADCSNGCPKTYPAGFDLDPQSLEPGRHTVAVAVNDRIASHTATSSSINVYVPSDASAKTDDEDDGQPTDFIDLDDNTACPTDPDYPNDPNYCEQDETDPLTNALRNEPGVDDTAMSRLRMGNLPPTASATAEAPSAIPAGQPCNIRTPISGPELTENSGRYGLSDQNAFGSSSYQGEDTFADANAQALQVKHLRLVVEFDLLPLARSVTNEHEWCQRYQKVYFWIARAQARGQDVLISFNLDLAVAV